jgi:hypothetical protein
LNTSYLDETRSALRGVVALILGDRRAPNYFDLGQRGLVGSFIALLGVLLLEIVVGIAIGQIGSGQIFTTVIQTLLFYGAITLAPRVLLTMLGRLDAFMPYLVALNWANVFFTLIIVVLGLIGAPTLALIVIIAAFIASINIARIIMTLKPMQIVMLFAVQLVGFLVALIVLMMLFPLSPEQMAELTAASSPQP